MFLGKFCAEPDPFFSSPFPTQLVVLITISIRTKSDFSFIIPTLDRTEAMEARHFSLTNAAQRPVYHLGAKSPWSLQLGNSLQIQIDLQFNSTL
jgi:hypothetical protein